ncbi:glycosyltransferase family 2 protein [Vibrio hyugaensis]|uniref:glycosyltransferase family 2 protein n=1 Tax=Vibrio hyugaensis TaxID=1534743 RepID=UPI0005F06841|nr:glycosyltransferase family 2 protein [Vibrio hyugaensis]
MAVYISVVSHGHDDLIKKFCVLENLANEYFICIKSNTENEKLNEISNLKNVTWINSNYGKGFGENNNIIFNYCKSNLGLKDEDYFIVLNPDVDICKDSINKLIKEMRNNNIYLAAINLFRDKEMQVYDNSVRDFPNFVTFVKSFLKLGNKTIIDKDKLINLTQIDWAAGSFLAFKASHYENLSGFDTKFFMYCEDIDICYRSHLIGHSVTYFSDIKAIHLAQHNNRKLFSKHFLWHLKSAFRFLLKRYKRAKVNERC